MLTNKLHPNYFVSVRSHLLPVLTKAVFCVNSIVHMKPLSIAEKTFDMILYIVLTSVYIYKIVADILRVITRFV